MTSVITQFFDAIAGTGNGALFFDFVISLFVVAVIILFVVEPITDNS